MNNRFDDKRVFCSDTELTLAQSNFPDGGESYYIRRPSQLNSTGANFTTRKVQIGDIVSNTTRGSATPVVTIINETTLTLTNDIFTSAGGYDDTFEILPLYVVSLVSGMLPSLVC